MNTDIKKCPVPLDQRPLNEYLQLRQSFDFNWTTPTAENFIKNAIILTTKTYINCGCIVFLTSTLNDNLIKNIIVISESSSIILTIIFLRVYLGWNYVYNRLIQATIAYEESGWYDGQIWVKTTETLSQDRLIAKYELLPIITKLKTGVVLFLGLTVSEIYLWTFINK